MALRYFVLAYVLLSECTNQATAAAMTHKFTQAAASNALEKWLAKLGLSELFVPLSAEGVVSPEHFLALEDADVTEFAKRHGLRLGDRATLRAGIETLRQELRTVRTAAMAHGATDETSVEKLQHIARDNEAALKGLEGCFASSGCSKEADYCLSEPTCRSKAAAAASATGTDVLNASPSRDAMFGAVAAMALPLSLAPRGAGLASCAMAQSEALALCMSKSVLGAKDQTNQPVEANIVAV